MRLNVFTVALLVPLLAPQGAAARIEAPRIKEHVRILSSDAFAGRGPTQAGEAKTIAYLAKQFAAMGLQPGGDGGSWFQDVPLVRYERVGPVAMSVTVGGATLPLRPGEQVTASSAIVGKTRLTGAPMLFLGYGMVAPELGWNSFEGADLKGKVAVFLAGDPDFEAPQPGEFGGRTLVYGGRFGAKAAAAAKAGAAAVLVIHETAPASYPWSQVAGNEGAPAFSLPPAPGAAPLGLTGWLHRDAAVDLFRRAGLDLDALKVRARDKSFRALPIGDARLSAELETRASKVVSRNVLARLPGSRQPDETIIYGAHWDAYGIGAPDAAGDTIRNGAVDNATGTATLIEIARAFAAGKRPERSLLFIGYTAEEKGLLGAEHYAARPPYPLETTVAVFNLDPHVVIGRARSFDLIGGGRTELEQDLVRVAAKHGLRVDEERSPEAGWYFRSDHFAFAKKGVPALAFRAGRDLVSGGMAAGNAAIEDYNANRYHQTTDEFEPAWDMAGAEQEGLVAYELGLELANSRRWPGWNDGVEYKAVRDATAAARR
ncbi:MAG TPA: M28 family peptidase [Allosphingosinicella sp.]|nr:M28 family peptidase [Allosphingosinicella sp.]